MPYSFSPDASEARDCRSCEDPAEVDVRCFDDPFLPFGVPFANLQKGQYVGTSNGGMIPYTGNASIALDKLFIRTICVSVRTR